MVYALGYDIGGANTKTAFIHTKNSSIEDISVTTQYFPIWKTPERLIEVLSALKEKINPQKIDVVGVTMTAELSDAYQTKREGVRHILLCIEKVFPSVPIHVLTSDAQLVSPQTAKKEPLSVASANWAATGWLVAKYVSDCIIMDVGSTTTSIIPIVNNQIAARGRTDLEKLVYNELVYTGSLRTNIAAITQKIPVNNSVARVSSELFAISADVHLLLDNITSEEYVCETTDNRGKTKAEASARLARVVCADTDMLAYSVILEIAEYVHTQQINQIAEALTETYTYTKTLTKHELPIVVTGMGKAFLAKKAAQQLGAAKIIDLETIIHKQAVHATPAVAIAYMAANKHEGNHTDDDNCS